MYHSYKLIVIPFVEYCATLWGRSFIHTFQDCAISLCDSVISWTFVIRSLWCKCGAYFSRIQWEQQQKCRSSEEPPSNAGCCVAVSILEANWINCCSLKKKSSLLCFIPFKLSPNFDLSLVFFFLHFLFSLFFGLSLVLKEPARYP